MTQKKFPRLAYNRLSTAGILIAVVAVLIMTFLYLVDAMASETNPYLGIFLYMIMPGFLVLGLLLIPIGMIHRWRVWKKTGRQEVPDWPKVDLNERGQRNASFIFFFGTILFLGMTAVGSYQAYHFSESVTFCGKICHKIMKPEYTAYQKSPHARVACVACHVGPGADWFAKSKLSGAYQVYAAIVENYPRPIPTPIENLRPARETCEQCHWPDKFFGGNQRLFNHYMYNEENRHWPINMLIKVGGANIRSGEVSDIHWHVNSEVNILYIARDHKRQDIPWVKVIDKRLGTEVVYQNEDDPPSPEELDSAEIRTMDCVDCHNRPSHIYNSPDHAVDMAMAAGLIDIGLPEIKRIAVEALDAEYSSEKEALDEIARTVTGFYQTEYKDIYQIRRAAIEQAVTSIQEEFANNIFPEMKVRWDVYPNHIGHFYHVGCMRCHEGRHVSDAGVTVTHECNACHIIMSQGDENPETAAVYTEEGMTFRHPLDIDEAWREIGCYECHSGTQP